MRTILPRSRSSALLALAMVLGVPALAEAQLFPNLPLRRRQRPDCSHENPQFKMIRQEYWGYYPTCWRRFPAGWGCPSPEAPNWEQAKRDLPLDKLPESDDAGADDATRPDDRAPMREDDPVGPRPDRPGNADFPPLPTDTGSPFDNPPKPPAGGAPNPGGAMPPADPPGGVNPGANPPADPPPTPPGGTAAAKPRKGRSLVAGLFGARRK